MISFEEAKEIALEKTKDAYDESSLAEGDRVILNEKATVSHKSGWLFYYNSKKCIETNDFDFMLIGDAPIFVLKSTGEATFVQSDPDPLVSIAEATNYDLCRDDGVSRHGKSNRTFKKKVFVIFWNGAILSILGGVTCYQVHQSIRLSSWHQSYINYDTQLIPIMFCILLPFLSFFQYWLSVGKRVLLLASLLAMFVIAWLHMVQYPNPLEHFREDFIGGYLAALLFSLPCIIKGKGLLLIIKNKWNKLQNS